MKEYKDNDIINVKQAADFLNLPISKVRNLMKTGKIDIIKIYSHKLVTTYRLCNEFIIKFSNSNLVFIENDNHSNKPPNKLYGDIWKTNLKKSKMN